MDIFAEVNKITKQANKKDVTVVRVESYELDKDPRKCAIIGHDMMNMDEQGVPKKVRVNFYDPKGKSRGIQDFADESAMMHTQPGGMVRLDKFMVRSDGSYVCSHMQRVTKKDGPRQDRNGNQFEQGIARAWTKIIPQVDETGNIAVIETASNKISRGRALVIPENSQGHNLTFGDGFAAQLKAAAKAAIEAAPDKTKAFLLFRQADNNGIKEMVIPNQKQNEAGNYVSMTKDEQLAMVDQHKTFQGFLQLNEKAKGVTIEAVPGFQLDVYGMLNDPHSGKPLENPRVQSMVNETTRQFALPLKPGQKRPDMVPHTEREYKLAVISYEIPKAEESNMASLQTLGSVPGVTASPNAGLSVTPNPHYVDPKIAAAEAATIAAHEQKAGSQASAAAPQAAPTEAAPAAAAAAPAPAAATPAPVQAAPEPSEDALDDAMDDMMEDFDIDDLERQLASQSL